ncbi:MAG: class II glutamine amidotransferase, partial [Eubacteriales bacterium]|nr:class II glutamine amidotransferase [Eubacteriales bacterium]
MCGIVGYIGEKQAPHILLDGLRKLEYRGYDSAGIVTINENRLQLIKAEGKVDILESRLLKENPRGTVGIGHTRWATHGKPSDENSHPHLSNDCKVAVVHNGIIENYMDIKEELVAEGYKFYSETDTEVIVHLIKKYMDGSFEEAFLKTVERLNGSYAVCAVAAAEPD